MLMLWQLLVDGTELPSEGEVRLGAVLARLLRPGTPRRLPSSIVSARQTSEVRRMHVHVRAVII